MHLQLFMQRQCVLGEGPLWDDRAGRLFWVDIRGRALEWSDVAGDRCERRDLSIRLSAIGMREAGGLIAIGDHALGVLDPDSGAFEQRLSYEEEQERAGNRANDGGVGADGRFWFGTMDDGAIAGRGAVYSLTTDWVLTRVLDGVDIPNGIVTDQRGSALYLADSGRQVIERRSLEPIAGALGAPELFADFSNEACTPDGAALDEEGCLWSALWDGARVVRFTPAGAIDCIVHLPVSRPTSCAFGGCNYRTLFITTARDGLSAERLGGEPLAGSIFALETGVRGAPVSSFAG